MEKEIRKPSDELPLDFALRILGDSLNKTKQEKNVVAVRIVVQYSDGTKGNELMYAKNYSEKVMI